MKGISGDSDVVADVAAAAGDFDSGDVFDSVRIPIVPTKEKTWNKSCYFVVCCRGSQSQETSG